MYGKRLVLKNFRNYAALDLELSPHVNIIRGKNAQGKTNLLEALYFCATGRSHRTTREKECIRGELPEAEVHLLYEAGLAYPREDKIDMVLKRSGAKTVSAAVNGEPLARLSDLFGNFHVVLFSPEDLSLIKNEPGRRRRFMDMELCQVDKVYLYELQQYTRILRQRNQLLKDCFDDPSLRDQLSVWDAQLASYGVRILRRRREFIDELRGYMLPIHTRITGGAETLAMEYETSAEEDAAGFLAHLERNRERDIRLGNTSVGPHRDDIALFIDGSDVRSFGSQGQQRTAALTMKLAEFEMLKKETGTPPVLLLDDVMSELDGDRQKELLSYIEDSQTVLTCTGIEDSLRGLPAGKLIEIEKGTILS